jgi:hypothetical protein
VIFLCQQTLTHTLKLSQIENYFSFIATHKKIIINGEYFAMKKKIGTAIERGSECRIKNNFTHVVKHVEKIMVDIACTATTTYNKLTTK